MRPTPPRLRRFAQRLLALEAARAEGAGASAAFHVTEKVRARLSTLAGVAGFRSLMARAVAQAGGEVAWLKALHVASDGSLEGLDDDTRARLSADEIAEGEAVLIARLLGLLTTFIGEGLTLRLVQDAWPEISAGGPSSKTEKDNG